MTSRNEVRPQTWQELEEQLFPEKDLDLQRYRTKHAFRGISNSECDLTTTLQRLAESVKPSLDCTLTKKSDPKVEYFILRNFRKYAPKQAVEQDAFWHWLVLAQHHGLPTRLLDWSNSPLVALHFVTDKLTDYNKDGVVWKVDFAKANKIFQKELRKMGHRGRLSDAIKLGASVFTISELSEMFPVRDVCDLECFFKKWPAFVLFFEPPTIDERIANQYALFSVMPRADLNHKMWLDKHTDIWQKVIIPKCLKPIVRDRLDQANITERVLFPGLDGLCQWLKRYYGPLPLVREHSV